MSVPNYEHRKARLKARLAEGALKLSRGSNLRCKDCGSNCGQCGYTDLFDDDFVAKFRKDCPEFVSPTRKERVVTIIGLLLAAAVVVWLFPRFF